MTHPTDALRLVPDEEQIFAWLNRKYVQRADERQRSMNLQYMEAETHDLSASLHRWLLAAAPASPLPGGGWRTDFENAPDCEEGILIVDATKISPAVGTARFVEGEWRGYNHGYGVECLWPSPTHWMPLPAAPTGEPK